MSNALSRRGVLIGAAATGAASCTTMDPNEPGGSKKPSSGKGVPCMTVAERLGQVAPNDYQAQLGILIASYAMDKVAKLRAAGQFDTTKSIPININLDLDLVILDNCCGQQNKIAQLLKASFENNQGKSSAQWDCFEPQLCVNCKT